MALLSQRTLLLRSQSSFHEGGSGLRAGRRLHSPSHVGSELFLLLRDAVSIDRRRRDAHLLLLSGSSFLAVIIFDKRQFTLHSSTTR